MRIYEYVLRGAEADEQVEYHADIAPLGGAGIQLAVGERPGAALAVAVVGIGVDLPLAREPRHVGLAPVHVLTPLEYHGPEPAGDEPQGREEPGRPGSDHGHGPGGMHVRELRQHIGFVLLVGSVGLVAVAPHGFLAGIYRALLQHPFHASRLGLYLLETWLAGQGAAYLELLHSLVSLQC